MGFANRMNGIPKYVVSATLGEPGWSNSTVIREDIAEEIVELKRRSDGGILVNGSGHLVRTLAEHGLVDEYRPMVYPVERQQAAA
ncbi:hypothetical protein GCM10009530_75110 [Microbispora corallina]|uniref:Bacterial bifunctional deaminase-reductase C-terminal domain-containing protein n=2 Tax=Microbispora corallina TaxID=83302 RepID=A0ABQ4G7Z0_9ACTN|nr:hypothetical protein Mco01_61840 [Microbispora corallina]